MRKLLFAAAFIACLMAFACGNSSATAGDKGGKPQKDMVEVLYFHGKQRCATCIAIEENAKQAVESMFADQIAEGTVAFRSIDISRKENEGIADKYEVTWSSLFVCRWKDGKEKHVNMTEFAFANARTAPEAFKEGLAAKITEMLE